MEADNRPERSAMSQREAFEAEIRSRCECEEQAVARLARAPDDDYVEEFTHQRWMGWQAAIQHARDVADEVGTRLADAATASPGKTAKERAQMARWVRDAIKEALK